MDCKTLSKRLV